MQEVDIVVVGSGRGGVAAARALGAHSAVSGGAQSRGRACLDLPQGISRSISLRLAAFGKRERMGLPWRRRFGFQVDSMPPPWSGPASRRFLARDAPDSFPHDRLLTAREQADPMTGE